MIQNPIHTTSAHLIWQGSKGGSRTRLPVALLRQEGASVSFEYLQGTPDFEQAVAEGFAGYTGIPLGREDASDAIVILGRRLLSEDRPDYADYLARFGISPEHNLPTLSLLSYTGAGMTSDSFSVSDTFEGFDQPFEYIFDVAGRQHNLESTQHVKIGDPVHFESDNSNEHDPNAVAIYDASENRLGYVNRCQAKKVGSWLDHGSISGEVFRANGTPSRPRLFVKVKIVPQI